MDVTRQDHAALKPRRTAAIIAGAYLVVAGLYIVFSDRVARSLASSVEQMSEIERFKGLAFVLVTSGLLYLLASALLGRAAERHAEVLRHRALLANADRQAMAGLFASSVAHDVKNHLMLAYAGVSLWEAQQEADPREAAALARTRKALDDLLFLSERLMDLGRRAGKERFEKLDLTAAAEEFVRFARTHDRLRGCQLRLTTDGPVPVEGHRATLGTMLLNLLLNAADATQGKGRIEVRVRDDGEAAVLEVHDDGPGVPEDRRDTIFEAFWTTKQQGTGLGLVAVRAAAEEHGGNVTLETSDLGGACFRVTIPRKPAPASRAS